ncbi:hypothetical protein CNR22_23680 [Sphingobacteriaceae bacterium]|nr:hypothetical protein CNR22_23680 [Sphingobacteriaceae bacterium]
MKNIKPFLRIIPEIILILIVIFYWQDAGLRNPVAPVLMGLLLMQLLLRRKTSGLIVSCIFLFLSLWMVLACLSDAMKIEEMNHKAWTFLFFGIGFLSLLGISSTLMFVKYVNQKELKNLQTN